MVKMYSLELTARHDSHPALVKIWPHLFQPFRGAKSAS
jgi:hypothetical protein